VSAGSGWSAYFAAFVKRLNELGWVEGRTVTIEHRLAEGRRERYSEIATEFVRLKVDVIVTGGIAVAATKQATSTIPIVFAVANDRSQSRVFQRQAPSRAQRYMVKWVLRPEG
jgi:putative ABC transport system substrate-binding protein